MSEAERVPWGGRPGALKQTKGHQEETIRDHWAELVLGTGDSDDMPSELTDIAEALQKHNPEMTVTNTQVQESWRRFCTKNPQLLEPDETTAPAAAESSELPAKPSRKPFKRLLILAAALALLLSLFTVQASGFDLFRTLAEWTASVLRIGNDAPAQITMGENDLGRERSGPTRRRRTCWPICISGGMCCRPGYRNASRCSCAKPRRMKQEPVSG